MDPSFADRYLNEGFSGGEKKRNEILQMAILEPEHRHPRRDRLGSRHRRAEGRGQGRAGGPRPTDPSSACSRITHYQRLLEELQPDRVHILDRRPHRRERRPRARRATRSRGVRRMAMTSSTTIDVAAIKRDFPLLTNVEVERQADRVPRLGVVVAEAPSGPRRDGRALRDHLRQRAPRRVRHRAPRPPSATRRRAARSPGSSAHRRQRGHRLHQERHRGDQPGRLHLGPGQPARGRRRWCSPRSSTTPTSCRG